MAVDLSQFHQVFFEESFESLDIMESSLMELDPHAIDSEIINQIFRAAHSIKGGAGTFGFNDVAEFTHVLETLLDEVRSGKRGISQEDIDLYLQSVDCLRDMLTGLQRNEAVDLDNAKALQQAFEKVLATQGNSATKAGRRKNAAKSAAKPSKKEHEQTQPVTSKLNHWQVDFKPGPNILRTGNEPLRMFRDIRDRAQLTATAIPDNLPHFNAMEPELNYLHWQLYVHGDITKADLEEAFEWVADESDITIAPLNEVTNESNQPHGWSIYYEPGADTLRTGNDTLRMFRELRELGPLQVSAYVNHLPNFESMHPEQSYLAWQLLLNVPVDRATVMRVFEWVADEAELVITPTDDAVIAEKYVDKPVLELVSSETDEGQVSGTASKTAAGTDDGMLRRPGIKAGSESSVKETNSIRVAIDKIDNLINMVGELVITQSMLGQIGTNFSNAQMPRLLEGLGQLEHNTRELQESVMRIRMLPISFAFSRFPRMVRDLSRRLGKQIELVLMGEQTELDKTVMERIGDPLVHLVRNAVDHGIELPDVRKKSHKPEVGKIVLNAYHQSGNVVIEVTDDGKGLSREKLLEKAILQNLMSEADANSMTDAQVFDLIFHPGFSTAQEVSDVSGRGVGMDVVKRNIQELNGTVDIRSEEHVGTTITIRLPLTLAILDGQLVRVGSNTYIFPLVSIVESLQIDDDELNKVAGGCDVFKLRHEYVPVIRLHEVFSVKPDSYQLSDSLLVVVESDGEKVGIVVDELAAQQQVVIKSLEQNYRRIEGVSGATILGDGTVSLILDVPGIVKIAGVQHLQIDALSRRETSGLSHEAGVY